MTKANLKNLLTAVRDIINRSSEAAIRKAEAAQATANNAQPADFVINITHNSGSSVTLDKTFEQTKEAISSGKTPIVAINKQIYLQMVDVNEDTIVFSAVTGYDRVISSFVLYMYPSGDPELYTAYSLVFDSDGNMPQVTLDSAPTRDMEIATKKYVDEKECILQSTTPNSTKKFEITVDDNGTLSATEVT